MVTAASTMAAGGKDAVTTASTEILAFFILVIAALGVLTIAASIWKTKRRADQEDRLRELVGRYEQLASATMDVQQRTSTDIADLRARTAAIEGLLRSVE